MTDNPATAPARRVKTPTVFQIEAVECGAACLAMILGYFGRWVTLEDLRRECGVSRDGSKASNISKAARSYGLKAWGRMSPVDDLLAQSVPAIIMWNNNHFVVFEGVKRGRFHINDPASGPKRLTREAFEKSYSKIALFMEPEDHFERGGSRPSILPSLAKWLDGSWGGVGLVFIVSIMLVIPGIAMAGLVKAFIDEVLIKGATHWLFALVVGLALAALANGLLTYVQQHFLQKIELKLMIAMSGRLFWHILRLPAIFFSQRYTGDIISRLRSAGEIARLMSGRLSTSLVDSVLILLYGAAMLMLNVELTLVLFLLTGVNGLVVFLSQRIRKDLNTEQAHVSAKLIATGMGGLQAIETIKATGTENDFFSRWTGYHANLLNSRQRLGFINSAIDMVPGFISQVMNAALLGFGGWLVIQGRMGLGDIVGFQILLGRFTIPVQSLVMLSSDLQKVGADLSRVNDAFNCDIDPVFTSEREIKKDSGKLNGQIDFQNITFAYGPLDPPVIKDVSLSIKPGMRVAFVGPSGSGKSTLVKLLLGLYQPSEGKILFDGMERAEVSRDVLNDSISNVDQDIMLFEGSVRDNLTMWDETVSDRVIRRAAIDASIHDVIAARSGGYDSLVEEGGSNFSGGQQQRIEIARSLVRDPSILVLDEATAALDSLTEMEIDDNLRRRGCTCVIVAHRLSTIRDADLIVVLDKGEISESGTYASLMEMNGTFAQLVQEA